ncbi:hypothetical protein ACWDBW_11540 [Streptomyces sp. NPDC001107]
MGVLHPAEGGDTVKWDDVTLVILAAFGCVTLLLTQITEVLSRLPQIIRAWRQVRQELNGGTASGTPTVDPSGRSRASGESEPGPGQG